MSELHKFIFDGLPVRGEGCNGIGTVCHGENLHAFRFEGSWLRDTRHRRGFKADRVARRDGRLRCRATGRFQFCFQKFILVFNISNFFMLKSTGYPFA